MAGSELDNGQYGALEKKAGKRPGKGLEKDAPDNSAIAADDGVRGPSIGREPAFGSAFAVPEPHLDPTPKRKALTGALLVIVSLAAGFFGGMAGASQGSVDGDENGLSRSAQQKVISSESQLISSIAETVGPSVVSIDVTSERASGNNFFGNVPTQRQSAGTGIILTGNGLIVTNRHVVPQGTTSVNVTLADGTELDEVEVVGRTRESDPLDVAFLKINDAKGKKLTPAKIGDSGKVKVGDRVIAIGNALGQFQNTVTSGIISGYGRNVQAGGGAGGGLENLQDLFQTDAAINQGNSGGPLVNAGSEVIGINTAVAGGAEGIGFAIPVNNISGLIQSVIKTGELKQPYLGVRYVPLTNDIAKEFGLSVTRGAYILPADQTGQPAIIPGSPAEKANLRAGDVILQVNGVKIDERHSLTATVSRSGVGDTITVKVLRDGKEQDIKVKLEASPAQ